VDSAILLRTLRSAVLRASCPLVLSCVAGAQDGRTPGADPVDVRARCGELLCEGAGAEAAAGLPRRLALLGPELVPVVLELLETMRLPAPCPGASDRLETRAEQALFEALALLERSLVLAQVDRSVGSEASDASRRVALRVLGVLAGVARLPLLDDVATRGREQVSSRVLEAYEDALLAVLSREPEGAKKLRDRLSRMEAPLVPAALRALGRCNAPGVASLLADVLRWERGHESVVLAELGRHLVPRLRDDPDLAELLRDFLTADRDAIVQAAALAVGRLRDEGSVPALIELAASEHAGIRANALWALGRITGQDLADAGAWQEWLDAEEAWYRRESPRLLDALASDRPERCAEAVREITRHPLFRPEFEQGLVVLLLHELPSLRSLACHAIVHLGCTTGLAVLVDLLEVEAGDEPGAAALHALRSLTGLDLGTDPERWREALEL